MWKFELVGFQSASLYMLQKSRFRINNWNLTRDLLTRSSHIQTPPTNPHRSPTPSCLANSLCWDYSGVGSRRIVYLEHGGQRTQRVRKELAPRCKCLHALHVSEATRKQWFIIIQLLEQSPATQTAHPPKLLC